MRNTLFSIEPYLKTTESTAQVAFQLGFINVGSSWAQVASRKPSWAILRLSRGLLRHVKQEIPNFTQKMIEFCSKIDEHLSQKYKKYVTIVAPNAFSRFSNKDLKIFDFQIILRPSRGIFEASWRPWETILGVLRPTWANIEPSWGLLEPTWRHRGTSWGT